ncbi:GDPmannose 4,6-dehydratase [Ketogulonicigenium robustum]|uniref:GDP-mannose 4,6-dehydratase n=1 Tax=Ketogulonicigenium robustum TaxID=92947 RepID=A0A1W6NYG8_9RHOB|nr:GDP-mannose 4,6-dehydratase [Ketogulonicigenium robustum]ARO14229.1 GDPmannose 4,6-dehydratase [Ketogulonicigenium robustum]
MKQAFITGITGQDGSYLAEFLIGAGYRVHGLVRRASQANTGRIAGLLSSPQLHLHYGDLGDAAGLVALLAQIRPDEVYNLAAQSDVAVSFQTPLYTADVNGMGTLRLLDALRTLGLSATRFYQASTSELFGLTDGLPQHEGTAFHPRSPYAIAKLFSYWSVINYRESYGFHASNGILFNHESPRRGEEFVARKITRGLARMAQGLQGPLRMGNIEARRDWGHARDYVRMQWLMLQQESPGDYVIATGQQYSVRDFLVWAGQELGVDLDFKGSGLAEEAIVNHVHGDAAPALRVGDVVMQVDPRYFRPSEVPSLLGDAARARRRLGWHPEVSARQLCAEMVASDLAAARCDAMTRVQG